MPTDRDAAVLLARLSYEQADTSLSRQQLVLNELRGRAQTVVTGGSVAASLLLGRTLSTGSIGTFAWCGLLAFLAVVVCTTVVLWPRENLSASVTSRMLPLVARDADSLSPAGVHRALARHLDAAYERNEPQVSAVATYLRASTIFLVIAIICWVEELALGL